MDFWVKNISKMNVSLQDLNITIPARTSMNLMDKKHFHYTLEQVEKSVESGSIFKKSDKIKIMKVPPPEKLPIKILELSKQPRIIPLRSLYKIEERHYEELDFEEQITSEEQMAKEFAEAEEKNKS